MERTSIWAAANELYRQRNFSQVVAACRAELAQDPEEVDLRLLLGRALMALRRDVEAQLEVSHCLRLRPRCPEAYQLLGELAFRRDELRAAEIFLREAVRLDESNAHAKVLLDIIGTMTKPTAAAAKLPAASAAVGPFPSRATSARPKVVASREDRTRVHAREEKSVAIRLTKAGFGEFLVELGVLTRTQLLSALQLHYQQRIRVGEAAVRLGFAAEALVERHARRYHEIARAPRASTRQPEQAVA